MCSVNYDLILYIFILVLQLQWLNNFSSWFKCYQINLVIAVISR